MFYYDFSLEYSPGQKIKDYALSIYAIFSHINIQPSCFPSIPPPFFFARSSFERCLHLIIHILTDRVFLYALFCKSHNLAQRGHFELLSVLQIHIQQFGELLREQACTMLNISQNLPQNTKATPALILAKTSAVF